jgi:hypothetical protein
MTCYRCNKGIEQSDLTRYFSGVPYHARCFGNPQAWIQAYHEKVFERHPEMVPAQEADKDLEGVWDV